MNSNDLYMAMNGIDDDILIRSERAEHRPLGIRFRRRISVALIAAVLMMLMMGAGVATLLYGDSIQSWFSHYWEMMTGHRMSDTHSALIDHLSQDIGLSQTVNGVTVTVDSATVGDDSFFLLIKVGGIDLSGRYHYGFDELYLDISPDPLENSPGIGSFGGRYRGASEAGEALILFDYDYSSHDDFGTEPWDITLSFDNFSEMRPGENKIIATGPWDFNFTLTPNTLDDVITIPDTEIMAFDHTADEYTEKAVVLKDIEISSTSLRFAYDYDGGRLSVDPHIQAVLSEGQEIYISGGSGTVKDGLFHCVYRWDIPIELNELTAVKFGNTVIAVP